MTSQPWRQRLGTPGAWCGLTALALWIAMADPAWGQNRTTVTNVTPRTITTGTVFSAWPTVSSDGRSVYIHLQFTQATLDHVDTFVLPTGTMSSPPAARPLVLTLPVDASGMPLKSAAAEAVHPLSNPALHGNQIYVDWDKKLLAAKLPAVKIENLPLAEGISKLAVLSQTNLALGLSGMKKAGIDTKMPVTLMRGEGTLRDALEELLEAPAKINPLVITAEDNVVFITTQAQADHDVVTRAYYIEDLMGNVSRYIPGGTNLHRPATTQSTPTNQASTSSLPGPAAPLTIPGTNVVLPAPPTKNPAPPPPPPLPPRSLNPLLEVITANVRPEIWKVNGGTIGEIAEFKNRITITAPKSVHALLEGPSHYNPNAVPMYVDYSTH